MQPCSAQMVSHTTLTLCTTLCKKHLLPYLICWYLYNLYHNIRLCNSCSAMMWAISIYRVWTKCVTMQWKAISRENPHHPLPPCHVPSMITGTLTLRRYTFTLLRCKTLQGKAMQYIATQCKYIVIQDCASNIFKFDIDAQLDLSYFMFFYGL